MRRRGRDAEVRDAVTALINYCQRHGLTTIAVVDLDFAGARSRTRGKQFRRTVSDIPTGRFRKRLASMALHAQIGVFAVNAAYTCIWGAQHW
ncbi:hypothetical protein ACOJVU_19995 [Mycobacterium sp. THU-M104]|uniref:hypothetical protein n=1 Tax=Mycobacterium sp. THU-M104 TaxID=3410515 RepID=UPI003B992167